eukprot:518145_1
MSQLSKQKCICGGILQPIEAKKIAKEIYIGRRIACDMCHRYNQLKVNDIFWHCSNQKNNMHDQGLDICSNCIEQHNQQISYGKQYKNVAKKNVDFETKNDLLSDCKCNCLQMTRLKNIMTLRCNVDVNQTDEINVSDLVNDYFHAIEQHKDNTASITCDHTHCESLKRQSIRGNNVECISDYTVTTQIMDKIHNHFAHCPECSELEEKRNKSQFIKPRQKRYNQLFSQEIEHKDQYSNSNNNTYHFGFKFKYRYSGETPTKDSVIIKSKYSSLKQELISNDIACISNNQYNNEYKKAKIYFNSDYCRKNFVAHKNDVEWIFLIQHILSLMIYCNFTGLQYQFSKTYRENKGKMHCNFFFLGL